MQVIHFTDKVNDEIVSSLYLYTVKLPSRYLGVIEEVNTKLEYRSQGRATKLIQQAIEKGKELGLDCIELTVRNDKKLIQLFYKSFGFKDRFNQSYRLNLNETK